MVTALVTHDFSVSYVAQVGSRDTPLFYTVISLWGALEGSILFWAWVLALYGMLVVWRTSNRPGKSGPVRRDDAARDIAVLRHSARRAGESVPSRVANAGRRTGTEPTASKPHPDGGASATPVSRLRRDVGPVRVRRGRRALWRGRVHGLDSPRTRPWTMASWGFLSAAIIAGMWWSYEVLGWGGYWAWDPVENASFLPWLTATAFLHSAMVQERRGMLRVWNLNLVVGTFVLDDPRHLPHAIGDHLVGARVHHGNDRLLLPRVHHARVDQRAASSSRATPIGCEARDGSTRRRRARRYSCSTTSSSRRSC